jgi:hypothetical protein
VRLRCRFEKAARVTRAAAPKPSVLYEELEVANTNWVAEVGVVCWKMLANTDAELSESAVLLNERLA